MGKPIYYMTATVRFHKKKFLQKRSVWIVSRYDNPKDIMAHDEWTMARLDRELLPPKTKNRRITIQEIESIKQVGTTSDASNHL